MSALMARRAAWTVFALAVVAEVASASMAYIQQRSGPGFDLEQLVGNQAFGLVILLSVFVGAVVASRLPGNPVGWLFLATASDPFYGAFEAYASMATALDVQLPAVVASAWLGTVLEQPGPAPAMLLFLFFPSGRLLSPRWRWVAALIVVWVVVTVAGVVLGPGAIPGHPTIANPTALDAVPGLSPFLLDRSGVLPAILFPLCAVSLVLRFRRARGPERQQVKWLLLSAILVSLAFSVVAIAFFALGAQEDSLIGDLFFYLVLLPAVASVPVAAGVAITRYRLYEIDRLISRTLVYAILMAVLAGGYAGLVVTLQSLLRPVTGGSDLAVAASTLVVAAAFGPVRHRVQNLVDRRFNRTRYDTVRTIESFSHRLRDEIDLDALASELGRVAARSVQPTAVSLWLSGSKVGP